MCIGRFGCVIQAECLAFEQHTVIVNQHRAVNEFEGALAVILEITDSVEGVGVVAFRLDLKAQFNGLPLDYLFSVRHYLHREGVRLLHIEIVRTRRKTNGGEGCGNESHEAEIIAKRFRGIEKESAGSKAHRANLIENCSHNCIKV